MLLCIFLSICLLLTSTPYSIMAGLRKVNYFEDESKLEQLQLK